MVVDTRENKLQGIIEIGKGKVNSVLEEIQTEFELRKDFIAKPEAINYRVNEETKDFQAYVFDGNISGNHYLDFTNFSKTQILNRLGIPVNYANRLLDLKEFDLLQTSLEHLTNKQCQDGLLFRQINNTVKGVLSPSYRRMDASPIFESFINSALSAGYVPYNGEITDYRYHVSFILPEVFQPSENEFCVMGLAITTSDYGANALQVELLCLRISCLNLCMGNDVMRSIHLGRRFNTEESFVQLSNKTHLLDSKTVASAVSDSVKTSIDLQTKVKERILLAVENNGEINIAYEIKKLRTKGVKKEIAEDIKRTFESKLPVELLPENKNRWRLSNAISLIANSQTPDIKLDLQKHAMNVI